MLVTYEVKLHSSVPLRTFETSPSRVLEDALQNVDERTTGLTGMPDDAGGGRERNKAKIGARVMAKVGVISTKVEHRIFKCLCERRIFSVRACAAYSYLPTLALKVDLSCPFLSRLILTSSISPMSPCWRSLSLLCRRMLAM